MSNVHHFHEVQKFTRKQAPQRELGAQLKDKSWKKNFNGGKTVAWKRYKAPSPKIKKIERGSPFLTNLVTSLPRGLKIWSNEAKIGDAIGVNSSSKLIQNRYKLLAENWRSSKLVQVTWPWLEPRKAPKSQLTEVTPSPSRHSWQVSELTRTSCVWTGMGLLRVRIPVTLLGQRA